MFPLSSTRILMCIVQLCYIVIYSSFFYYVLVFTSIPTLLIVSKIRSNLLLVWICSFS